MNLKSGPYQYIQIRNLLTYFSLISFFLGLSSSLLFRSIEILVYALGFCVIFDIFDGKFSSLFKSSDAEKKLGGLLDSFTDLLAFGVLPLIIGVLIVIHSDSTTYLRIFYIFTSIFYLIATLTRLAYYEIFNAEKGEYFIGVPTTVAGVIWVILFYLPIPPSSLLIVIPSVQILLSLGMISTIKINRPGMSTLVFISLLIIALSIFKIIK